MVPVAENEVGFQTGLPINYTDSVFMLYVDKTRQDDLNMRIQRYRSTQNHTISIEIVISKWLLRITMVYIFSTL
jgi:hypothetical protein